MVDTIGEESPQRRPARTPEEQEDRLISLAVEQVERQLEQQTAPTQIVGQLLKLATLRERKEMEKIQLENELLKARATQISSESEEKERMDNALNAFRTYSGYEGEEVFD